jgi:hypothetical protein
MWHGICDDARLAALIPAPFVKKHN